MRVTTLSPPSATSNSSSASTAAMPAVIEGKNDGLATENKTETSAASAKVVSAG